MALASVTVVTFFTEGYPHDEGTDLTDVVVELRRLLDAHSIPLVAFTPRLLNTDTYFQRHCLPILVERDEPGMELLPNACKLGYYAWKPLVICKALEQIPQGSNLLFMDAYIRKYPQYKEGIDVLKQTCNALLDLWC